MKCFQLNKYEWYAGNDAEEAVAAAMANSGNTREETVDESCFHEADPNTTVLGEADEMPTTIGDIVATMTKPGFVCGQD